ncbi:PspA/IM30 family protein [Atlantibacter hermannii]|uniref:PspA/IM30 family protein n=1 Tax=Atlantibacter hermannii TaxID=565 RepID=UPI001C6FEF50|nr:PspA/IM30 family protein [Atlantibacter hermannii]MBW9429863.1 PspA/IM30 family protein [Atlantibacter hermannii]
MSILKKLFTLGKSLVNDTEVLIEETQGIRLLEQHIRDARAELDKAGEARVDLLARVKLSKDKLNELNTRKMTLESRAVDAMQKQVDESLLLEVAEEISRLEAVIASEEDVLQNLTHSREVVEQAVAATRQRIARFEQQLEVVKATEATQCAQQAVTTSAVGASSSMATAADSLKRIQTQQAERQARLEAAESIEKIASGRDLDEKLARAGVGGASTHSAQDVLARLRNQRND